jgi:hypothetical protein
VTEKKLTFKEKLDIILYVKGLTLKDLEEKWGKNGTLYKAIKNPKGLSKRLLDDFLLKFSIKKSWWLNPVGITESDIFEKNGTEEPKSEQADILDSPLVKSYVEQISLLKTLLKSRDEEIDRLKGQLGK